MQFYVLKKFFSPPCHFLMQKRRNKKISNYSVTSLLVLHPTKASLIMKPPYLSVPPTIPPTFHNQSVTSYHYLFPNKTFEKVRKNITTTYSTRLPTRAQGKSARQRRRRGHIFSALHDCASAAAHVPRMESLRPLMYSCALCTLPSSLFRIDICTQMSELVSSGSVRSLFLSRFPLSTICFEGK